MLLTDGNIPGSGGKSRKRSGSVPEEVLPRRWHPSAAGSAAKISPVSASAGRNRGVPAFLSSVRIFDLSCLGIQIMIGISSLTRPIRFGLRRVGQIISISRTLSRSMPGPAAVAPAWSRSSDSSEALLTPFLAGQEGWEMEMHGDVVAGRVPARLANLALDRVCRDISSGIRAASRQYISSSGKLGSILDRASDEAFRVALPNACARFG